MEANLTMIPMVDAGDFPADVLTYCVEEDISTHYQNDIVFVKQDDTLANWLKTEFDYIVKDKGEWIGIMAT